MSKTVPHNPHAGARPQSRWGRSSRLGGGTRRLIGVSLGTGVLLTGALGLTAWGLSQAGPDPDLQRAWLVSLLAAAFCYPGASMLAWVLLVDRESVRGAVKNTEDTVEGHWYEKATSGAFHDLLILLGLGGSVVTLAGWQIQTNLIVMGLLLFMAASTATRYLLQKRQG